MLFFLTQPFLPQHLQQPRLLLNSPTDLNEGFFKCLFFIRSLSDVQIHIEQDELWVELGPPVPQREVIYAASSSDITS